MHMLEAVGVVCGSLVSAFYCLRGGIRVVRWGTEVVETLGSIDDRLAGQDRVDKDHERRLRRLEGGRAS